MIFNNEDKLYLVNMEDTIAIERLASILNCKGREIIDEYDKLFETGEYYYYQAVKLRMRGIRP